MDSNFLSTSCRAFRYFLAILGTIMSIILIGYGISLRMSGQDLGVTDDVILIFGSLVALMSATIGCMANMGDRQVHKMITAMKREHKRLRLNIDTLEGKVQKFGELNESYSNANDEHRRVIKEAELQYKKRITSLQNENRSLNVNLEAFTEENCQLRLHLGSLESINQDYKASLDELRHLNNQCNDQITQMQLLNSESQVRVKELEELSREQRLTIAELTKHADNLNELQRKSVKMIQMLSLYGDECKTMGVSLKEVSNELKETDESLGLTSREMAVQLQALQKVTLELINASSES